MANKYIVAGGNWNGNNTSIWADSSGGAPGASVPQAGDDVFMDAASGNVNVAIFTGNLGCNNLDCSGFTGTLSGNIALAVGGSLTFGSGMNLTYTGSFSMTSTTTGNYVRTNSVVNTGSISFSGASASWYFYDNYVSTTKGLTFVSGSLSANNKDITCTVFSSNNVNTRALTMGSGTWTCLAVGGTPWNMTTPTGLTVDSGTSTIKFAGSLVQDCTFAGGGMTFYNFWNATIGAYNTIISGSNTFNDFKSDAGRVNAFTAGTTQTVSSLTAIGTVGNNITLKSLSDGSTWTISKSSGTVNCDYLTIKDSTATGGATWNAGSNSTNVSNNNGWTFLNRGIVGLGSVTGLSSITL
jgi:hypothetical protein